MFKKLAFLALFCCAALGVNAGEDQTIDFRIQRNDYTFSTVFEMSKGDALVGTVHKSVFHLLTHYDVYDSKGEYKGYGVCRFLTLGVFYTWATEIDIYDAHSNYVGMIDGQVVSTEPAKFSIYDGIGSRTGIAYLDKNCTSFSIMNPQNGAHLLARFSRNYMQDTVDCWDVSIYEKKAISSLIHYVFAAFACDTQGQFKSDQ